MSPFFYKGVDMLSRIESRHLKLDLRNKQLSFQIIFKRIKKKKKYLQAIRDWSDLKIMKNFNFKNIILMHCVSNYPTKLKDANVKVIERIKMN